MLKQRFLLFLGLGLQSLAWVGSGHAATPDNGQGGAGIAKTACSLLTKEEVAEIQKATIASAQASAGVFQDFATTQCVYQSSEPDRSVSLLLIQSDPARRSSRSIDDYWGEAFESFRHSANQSSSSSDEKDRPLPSGESSGSEEEEAHKKQRVIFVPGIGEEAFWSGPAQVGGVLYVKQGEKILRVSCGGPNSDEERLAKSKALALKALARLYP